MDFSGLIRSPFTFFNQFMPILRIFWTATIGIGIVLLISGLVVKKSTTRKKMPWILGIIGAILIVNSGTQLIFSLI